jgi:hypothetical protein
VDGSASKGSCSNADQVKHLRTVLHHDVARHCKRLGIESETLHSPSGLDVAKKMRSFARFAQLAQLGQKEGNLRKASIREAPGLTAGMTSALKKRLTMAARHRNLQVPCDEADISEQVSDGEALTKLAQFFAGLDISLRDALNRIAPRGEHRVRLNDWNFGLAQIGFTGNAAQAFRLLDARNWRVLIMTEVEAQMLLLDRRLAVPPAGSQLPGRTPSGSLLAATPRSPEA